jgi:hypothetical protein
MESDHAGATMMNGTARPVLHLGCAGRIGHRWRTDARSALTRPRRPRFFRASLVPRSTRQGRGGMRRLSHRGPPGGRENVMGALLPRFVTEAALVIGLGINRSSTCDFNRLCAALPLALPLRISRYA